ncbi:MAG: MBOAT family protein [Eubacteriales bacterium]|nr:MBOAT family protein [Eubacteriales bacterium]
MLFSSLTFLYYFLPAVLLVYFAVPAKLKNPVLLTASLLFYAWGEPRFVLFMVLSILVHYAAGLAIAHDRGTRRARLWLILALAASLGLLGYVKYADFFIGSVNAVSGLGLPLPGVVLPIGISFYTFQILSYTIDVYRGQVEPQKNLISLATYIALFPQLIAGPIVRYADIAGQLAGRHHSLERLTGGLRRFVIGLAKKILIANTLGEIGMLLDQTAQPTVLLLWLTAVSFMLQIYFDFSGYSDMAIGLGRVFGFDFLENFNYPYMARSITEFWRRWHISLGTWFRDYCYIPLGGSRTGKGRWLRNLAIVWLLTGLWHGAAWTFVLWGLLFALLLIVEKLWLGKRMQHWPAWAARGLVLLVVLFSFVLFEAPDLPQAVQRLSAMLGGSPLPLADPLSWFYLRSYLGIILIAIVGATSLPARLYRRLRQWTPADRILTVTEPLAGLTLLLVMTGYLADASFNPFLYFRF